MLPINHSRRSRLRAAALGPALVVALAAGSLDQPFAPAPALAGEASLLNVSYDPTRELWKEINALFAASVLKEQGVQLAIRQSHGGSGSQARAIVDGLEADVATLALYPDTDAIRKAGLIDAGWVEKLPNRSLPYTSTLVFLVRKGNPKGIHDWEDLRKEGIQIVTPNPKTSGNGKLSFLAAWGHVLKSGGSEADARAFVAELYRKTPVLDTGARGSTTTFTQKGIGDVLISWENEAYLSVQETGGQVEVVYPKDSILAEPHVAVVDRNVERHGTRDLATAYLKFLYTPEGQAVIARHHYRPTQAPELLAAFPKLDIFPISVVAPDFDAANERFFNEGAIFDQIYTGGNAAH